MALKPFPEDFVRRVIADISGSWADLGGCVRHLAFGPVEVELRTLGRGNLEHLFPAISHGAQSAGFDAPVIVYALDSQATGMAPPPDTWPVELDGDAHQASSYWSADTGIGAACDLERGIWSLYDANKKTALCWYRDGHRLPEWEPAAPFRIALHWAALSFGAQMVHGAAIGKAGRGILLTGPGGSGKSTTTAAAIEHGLETSGEDFVLLDGGHPPKAHALYDTLKLTGMALDVFPRLAGAADNPDRSGDEKARVHLSKAATQKFVPAIAIHVLVSSRIANAEHTTWHPSNRVKMLQALAPSTMFLLRTAMRESFEHMATLVRDLPCYQLELGRDPREVAMAMENFIETMCP